MQKGYKRFMPVLAIVVLMSGLTGCSGQTAGNANGITVKTAAADKHKLQTTLDVTGVLVPTQSATIAAKTGGQVKSITADVGSSVKAGDILITLETKELNAQLQQAEAAVRSVGDQAAQARLAMDAAEKALNSTRQLLIDQADQAKINLDAAQKALERTKQLFDSQAVSQSQLDDAQSRFDLARKQYDMAQLDSGSSAQSQMIAAQSKYDQAKKQYETALGPAQDQSQAAVNSIKVQLENATITSPINGVVTNRNINPGEIASPSVSLVTIADTSTLKLKGTIPQEAVPLLQVGQEINISIDIYPNKKFTGKITNIGPMAVSTGAYFPIEISLSNSGDIKAGLSARASVNLNTNEAVIVPASAVIQNNGQSYVFVIKDNIAAKRMVTVGLKNDKEIEILNGLDAGEQVAVINVNSLFDKMPVTVN